MYGMIERKQSQLLVLLLLDVDAHLGVKLVRSISVFGESLGEIGTDCSKQTAVTEIGDD